MFVLKRGKHRAAAADAQGDRPPEPVRTDLKAGMEAVVIERVEFAVFAGREDEFEETMRGGIALLKGADGCGSVTLARGVEEPARYLLMLQWRSIEDHMAFTRTGEFVRFRQMAAPFFADAPSRLHFAPVIEKH